ncbi:MAG: RT0821/Lpp0805 family surface protein [Alphaproteobacteria bacterium]
MRLKFTSIASSLAMAAALGFSGATPAQAACNQGAGTKEIIGTIGGAVIGGLIGSRIGGGTGRAIAIAGGVVIGGALGNMIGKTLDCDDVKRHNQATYQAMNGNRNGTATAWRNPNTGAHGSTTPTSTYTNNNGDPCRNFDTTVTNANGQSQSGQGVACRNSNGGWDVS